ncbi:MAG TPA: potassium-transporting ATPase subunit KdpC [Bacteroidales bacterium]|jgi:K+-transporting ATPase ATPase C chain|nr:potassium-transporting ATPase subunit KdpC [Bacteroidales bacterium]
MKTIIISIKIFLIFTILTGFVYPIAVTGISRIFFPEKSAGSLIYKNNIAVGSSLIGQSFDTAIYFSSRPSAVNYKPLPSGGSNLGMTSENLRNTVKERIDHFLKINKIDSSANIPSEMIYASGSGLDPHISLKSALLQQDRVASSRNFSDIQRKQLSELIKKHTEPPQFNLLGETRINVLLLNLDVDKIK